MARGNMFLGQARGKVGDIVFSRNNGQQITRVRAAVVKNPRSDGQVLSRIVLNTVAQAYSKLNSIANHSFEGIGLGQPTMSIFMKRNLEALRGRISRLHQATGTMAGIYSFAPLGTKMLTINPWILSEGSLPSTSISGFTSTTDGVTAAILKLPFEGMVASYQDVITALRLQRGDQLTFCQMSEDPIRGIVFDYFRVILDPENEDGSKAPLTSSFILGNAIGYPCSRNEGNFAALSIRGSEILFNVDGNPVVGACVIVSREGSNGLWLRSSQALRVVDNPMEYGQYSLLDAINLFNSGGIALENSRYLNGADNLTTSDPLGSTASGVSLQSISMAGGSLFSPAAGTLTINQANYGLQYTLNNYSETTDAKIIFTPRQVAAGSALEAQSGDLTVNCTAASGSANLTFEQGVLYRPYFVVDGSVVNILRPVQWPSGQAADNTESNITSVKVNGNTLAKNSSMMLNEGNNTIIAQVAAGTDGLTYALGIVPSAQAVVGQTVTTENKANVASGSATVTFNATTSTADQKVILMQNNVVKQVWATITAPSDDEGGY